MKKYKDLTLEEKDQVLKKALIYISNNFKSTHKLFNKNTPMVEPSGSDMFKPELWKDIHWKWYLEGK